MDTNLKQFEIDIQEDLAILSYLNRDLKKKGEEAYNLVKNNIDKKNISLKTFIIQYNDFIQDLESITTRLENIKSTLTKLNSEKSIVSEIIREKNSLRLEIRSFYKRNALLSIFFDWQSPVFREGIANESGKFVGKIIHSRNDYKRDHNLDTAKFEAYFSQNFLNSKFPLYRACYATNSGMASYTTIFMYLVSEKNILNFPVVIGKNLYFEISDHLKSTINPKNLNIIDESDPKHFVDEVMNISPSVIFLDSSGNNVENQVIDIPLILDLLEKVSFKGTIVLDNTITSALFKPESYNKLFHKFELIIFESLNKYYEYGMDLVTGGIIYGNSPNLYKLYFYRGHCGTILSDFNANCLPTPNNEILNLYINRIKRNTKYLATRLNDYISTHKTKIEIVKSPYLENHTSFEILNKYNLVSPFLMLKSKKRYESDKQYLDITLKAVKKASNLNVNLSGGTSFGLAWTRIYPTATQSKFTETFLRISPGIETLEELSSVYCAISEAIKI